MSEVINRFHYDESTDTSIIETVQDVEPIIEANKRQFNAAEAGYKSETFNHVARIPEVLALKWCNQKGIKYQEFLNNPNVIRRFLQDPDNAMCKTRPGNVL